MTTTDPTSPSSPIPAVLTDVHHSHDLALAALADPGASSLIGVTWASAHLAAVERVVYPEAARLLVGGRERVREQTIVDDRLQDALWRLDRSLTGDARMRGVRIGAVEDDVRTALHEHAEGEHDLVAELRTALDPEQQQELSTRLATAMMRGPTRPHPHTKPGRTGARMTFWFGGVVDRARDGMDGRAVPTPRRVVPPLPMTRWGWYAVGPHRWPPQG